MLSLRGEGLQDALVRIKKGGGTVLVGFNGGLGASGHSKLRLQMLSLTSAIT